MKYFNKYFSRLVIISVLILFLVGCDQTTKKFAETELKGKATTEFAGIINLHYVENDGGMLSLGSKLPEKTKFIIFILIISIFLSVLFFYILKNSQKINLKQAALILIFCGGLGNLIDRIFNSGNVIDFIRLRLPLVDSGIFNFADIYITLGFILLLLAMLKKEKIIISN
jgi:signal peptidase II